MKVKKQYLEVLFLALRDTTLSLSQARVRDLALRKVQPELDAFYNDRRKIYETFAKKDADGNPDIKQNLFTFEKEEAEKMGPELEALNAEEVELDIKFPDVVKTIVENTEYKPKTGESELIDEVLKLIV